MYSKELLSSLPVRSLIQICNIKVCPVVHSSVYRNLVVIVDITMQLGTLRQVDAAAVSVECEMVLASLTGQFKLPKGHELVSAVYWVATPGKFTKPVTIEVQHCGKFESGSELHFVRTSCTQKSLNSIQV